MEAGQIKSPFNLEDPQRYQQWKEQKLKEYPATAEQLIVKLDNPFELTSDELARLRQTCKKANTVIYKLKDPIAEKEVVREIGHQLGLHQLDENICADGDGISGLKVQEQGSRHENYIPYTNKSMNWHTDGYYNLPDEKIGAMILHCVSDAADGGVNSVLDHEIVYMLMRDHDPEMVRAFMREDVMTIPANYENDIMIRSAQTGPVFSVDAITGQLHMRYTARTRSIVWNEDEITTKARKFLDALFADGNEYLFNYRLQPGEGIVSNNALHNRTAFKDDAVANKHRLIYRARYFDRVDENQETGNVVVK